MPKLAADQVKIQFKINENKLSVSIHTPRLNIHSVTLNDIEHYVTLFADRDVMTKYASGKPNADRAVIENRIKGWSERWEKDDPFNGLAVFDRNSGEFIGHIVLGRSDEESGVSELAYLFHKKFWNQGIGTEAVSAVVNHYAPEILKRNYKLDGHIFNRITATTRVDHEFSRKILETVGLTTNKQINYKFDAERYIYNLPICKPQAQNTWKKQVARYGFGALLTGIGLYSAYRMLYRDGSKPAVSNSNKLTP